jgi:hypothetical protein
MRSSADSALVDPTCAAQRRCTAALHSGAAQRRTAMQRIYIYLSIFLHIYIYV